MTSELARDTLAMDFRSQTTTKTGSAAKMVDIISQMDAPALRRRIQVLETELITERGLRKELETELQRVIADRDQNWTPIIDEEERRRLRDERSAQWLQHKLTGLKNDGNPIARPADSLESYTQMQQFLTALKNTGRLGLRNWAIFRVGICMGLRVSDLMKLKWNQLLQPDGSWRERIPVVEQKTSKLNLILITEAVKETLEEYRASLSDFDMNRCVFTKTTGEPLGKKSASQILFDANKVVQLRNRDGSPVHVSSHTMRKTFANIVVSCYNGTMEIEAIDKARAALNHDSLSSTKYYLSTMTKEVDMARKAVSDFVLGKTDVDVLGVPKMKTNNELYEALNELKKQVDDLQERSGEH